MHDFRYNVRALTKRGLGKGESVCPVKASRDLFRYSWDGIPNSLWMVWVGAFGCPGIAGLLLEGLDEFGTAERASGSIVPTNRLGPVILAGS
jgi:hypothetical protein